MEVEEFARTSLEDFNWDTELAHTYDNVEIEDNPLEELELVELDQNVRLLFQESFKGQRSATEEELLIGARLARGSSRSNHRQ